MLCERSFGPLARKPKAAKCSKFQVMCLGTLLFGQLNEIEAKEEGERKAPHYYIFLLFRRFRARKNASDVKIAVELKGLREEKKKKSPTKNANFVLMKTAKEIKLACTALHFYFFKDSSNESSLTSSQRLRVCDV